MGRDRFRRAISLFEDREIPKAVRENLQRHLAQVESKQPIRER